MTQININPQQKKAIQHKKGPLLIVAGAGTGKTTVITERIKFLITKQKINPKQILALTFTEKAAEEILHRVDEAMPLGYVEPWLSTFHSFCERILREEALEIGLDPSFKILSEPEQWLLIRKNIFDFDLKYYRPLGNPSKFISAMLQFFSRAKDEIISADDFIKYAKSERTAYGVLHTVKNKTTNNENRKPYTVNQLSDIEDVDNEESEKQLELAYAYQKYQQLLINENAMDFGDLLLWTIRLFRLRKSVLNKYQTQFKHILIDEFQDTNIAQFEIIKLLAPAKKNPDLVVVGDDDQAIFKFRGASISNILDFKKEYKKAKTIVLTQNYRSTQKILDASYKLIQNNNPDRLEQKLKINKKLQSVRKKDAGYYPIALTLENMEIEGDFVINKIINLIENKGYKYSDFAILARANNHLDPFVLTLRRNGIPYSLVGNRGLFNQEEIKCLISLLRFLTNHEDNASLYHLLTTPFFSIPPEELSDVLLESRKNKVSLISTLENKSSISKPVKKLFDLLMGLKYIIHNRLVSQILYEFLTSSGFIKSFLTEETIENSLKIKNINLFFEKVKHFETQTENPTVYEFIDYLDLLIEAGENPAQAEIEDIDTVKLLTVHSAKGLEFPVVFVVSLTNDRFPSRERKEALPIPLSLIKETLPKGDYHLEEERRLFYVAATRAKDILYFSYAKNYGGVREKRPSGFLGEIITVEEKKNDENLKNIEISLFTEKVSEKTIVSEKINIQPLSSNTISYSQMETFNTCPLKYYYKYVLGVTGIPNPALNFGQVMHRTLRDFHRYDLFNKDKTIEGLLKSYESHFTELAQGYQSRKHKEEVYNNGQDLLKKYFYKQSSLFGKPVFLEQKFKINVGSIFLIGAIDRIDLHEDKSYEIIDYKTGESKDKEKKIDKDEQLTIYALAAKEQLGINPEKLTLYFLENEIRVTTKRSEEQIETQKQTINNTVSEIKQSKFPAKVGMWCKWCEFNRICPFYSAGKNDF